MCVYFSRKNKKIPILVFFFFHISLPLFFPFISYSTRMCFLYIFLYRFPHLPFSPNIHIGLRWFLLLLLLVVLRWKNFNNSHRCPPVTMRTTYFCPSINWWPLAERQHTCSAVGNVLAPVNPKPSDNWRNRRIFSFLFLLLVFVLLFLFLLIFFLLLYIWFHSIYNEIKKSNDTARIPHSGGYIYCTCDRFSRYYLENTTDAIYRADANIERATRKKN